ncbi:MAG: DUF456 domain-containing protein [Cellulomonadaceae bacterium]
MSAGGEVVIGLVIAFGLFGVVVQVVPGSLVVLGAVAVWAALTGGAVGWTVLGLAVAAVAGAGVGKYLVAGRYLVAGNVRGSTLVWGGLAGVIGFFVVPVVGLPVGFMAGVFLAQLVRRRDAGTAWRATVVALKATGLSILIELAGALVATGAWVVGLIAA